MNHLKVILGVIVCTIILIIIVGYFTNTENQEEGTTVDQREKIAWQLLQKTYLEQECREKYMGQSEKLEKCFDSIEEEQRLNPPAKP